MGIAAGRFRAVGKSKHEQRVGVADWEVYLRSSMPNRGSKISLFDVKRRFGTFILLDGILKKSDPLRWRFSAGDVSRR